MSSIEIKAPTFPDSITSGILTGIYAEPGKSISANEQLFDIETDKVILEVVAPEDGRIQEYFVQQDETIHSNQTLALFIPDEQLDQSERDIGVSTASNGTPPLRTHLPSDASVIQNAKDSPHSQGGNPIVLATFCLFICLAASLFLAANF